MTMYFMHIPKDKFQRHLPPLVFTNEEQKLSELNSYTIGDSYKQYTLILSLKSH